MAQPVRAMSAVAAATGAKAPPAKAAKGKAAEPARAAEAPCTDPPLAALQAARATRLTAAVLRSRVF